MTCLIATGAIVKGCTDPSACISPKDVRAAQAHLAQSHI